VNIKGLKEARAINWSALARRVSVHPSAISHTLHGRSKSRRIRRIIANAVGLRVEQLWPEEKAS